MPPKQAESSSSSSHGVAAGVNVKALEIGRHIPAPPLPQIWSQDAGQLTIMADAQSASIIIWERRAIEGPFWADVDIFT